VLGPLAGVYGVGMTGQAMVQAGSASGDEGLVGEGLRAELAETEHPDGGGFELLSLAEAYTWNEAHLSTNPSWLAAGPAIAAFLGGHRASISDAGRCYLATGCYDNLKLVAAVADLALLRTGLSSSTPGALLSDPAALRAQALALVRKAVRYTGTDARRLGRGGFADAGIVSDPTENPLAYEALSADMLGHAVLALGPAAPAPAQKAFARAARALLGLMAPDGDVAYIGRGQGQVWTVGVSVDALAIAADATSSPVWRGRYLAGVALALRRLATVYPRAGWGFPLVPRLAGDSTPNYLGLDRYANTVTYDGLTLWALQDAAGLLTQMPDAPSEAVPSQSAGVFLDPSHTRFATVTQGGIWFVVHATDSNPGDARYGFGLLAGELRTRRGWRPVLPPRPLTSRRQVGGLAMSLAGKRLYPVDGTIAADPGGEVVIRGEWGTAGAHIPKADLHATWTYRPTPSGNGVVLSFRARPRCAYEFQVWYVRGARLRSSASGLSVTEPDGSTQAYSFDSPVAISTVAGAFHSAYAETLSSSVLTVPATARAHTVRYLTALGIHGQS
jgi:hypothetical protein